MKINSKILSIPPYLSTSWKNVASLHVEDAVQDYPLFVVTLVSGLRIEIPRLDLPLMDAIFAAHAKFMDEESTAPAPKKTSFPMQSKAESFVISDSPICLSPENLEKMGAYIQHDSSQMDSPELPEELLNKVTALSKTVGITDPNILPKPEPHCNCPYCQIAKAIQKAGEENLIQEEPEEEVSEEDLHFRTWDISKTSDKLYLVSNPLDDHEHYSVFLGDPIGCTCGKQRCEHVHAVLKS